MNLKELLNIETVSLRNSKIRDRLKPSNPPVDASGYEAQMFLILINLGYSKNEHIDLLNLHSAKQFLNDKKYFGVTLSESAWIHTHNSKYPDIRVSDQAIRAKVLSKGINGVCSQHCSHSISYSYSHNGGRVTRSFPLITEFCWNGKVTCLAELIANCEAIWIEQFLDLGFSLQYIAIVVKILKSSLATYSPNKVHNTIQLRFPYKDDYIAITPVVSHRVLSELQKACANDSLRYRSLLYPQKGYTNTGSLLTGLGGRINVLSYYSNTMKYHQELEKYVNQLTDESLFYNKALSFTRFKKALYEITFSVRYLTLRAKRLARIDAIKVIRRVIYLWLFRILRYKKYANLDEEKLREGSLIKELVEYGNAEAPSLAVKLNAKLNLQLSENDATKKFAYHPKLLELLKRQIKYVLHHRDAHDEHLQSNFTYLHVKNITAEDINTLSNLYLWGMPSIIALTGFSHEFELNLRRAGVFLKVIGVAIFVHSYQVKCNSSLPECDRINGKADQYIPARPALVDLPRSRMKFDLVFRLALQDTLEANISLEVLANAFPDRIMGGEIFLSDKKIKKQFYLTSNIQELFSFLRFISHKGCWLCPTDHRLRGISELSSLLKRDEELKPVHIGYAYLEQPKSREGAISSRHCFGESILGIAKCVHPIDANNKGLKFFFDNAFWAPKISEFSTLMTK
ncbi:type I-F CRISPR-associated protein Csy2 [Parashewanella tropica]|uniref:type I-F CRISPR-associated protein Csy2 n=1 Tax=Parashewanella tropica TaxID=2547970 RepID=UPI001059CC7B|nr:type I-F CRISPR-associated protein Csy2 [Parashewanella tropica]